MKTRRDFTDFWQRGRPPAPPPALLWSETEAVPRPLLLLHSEKKAAQWSVTCRTAAHLSVTDIKVSVGAECGHLDASSQQRPRAVLQVSEQLHSVLILQVTMLRTDDNIAWLTSSFILLRSSLLSFLSLSMVPLVVLCECWEYRLTDWLTDWLTLPGVDVPLARHLQPGEVGVLLTDGAAEGLLSRQCHTWPRYQRQLQLTSIQKALLAVPFSPGRGLSTASPCWWRDSWGA